MIIHHHHFMPEFIDPEGTFFDYSSVPCESSYSAKEPVLHILRFMNWTAM